MLFSWLYRQFKSKKNEPVAAQGGEQPPVVPQEGQNEAAAPTPSPAPDAQAINSQGSFRWRMMLIVALLFPIFLETLDYTVVATAQPHIASVFHRLDLQSYIGTSYLLTSTVFLPLFASVADIFGRHWALQISLVFFILGSAISTAAQNMAMMIMGRGIAGVGAAGLLAVVRIILSDSGSLDDNTWQVSVLFFLYAVGYSVGPVIGGLLVSVSFRWVFAINLPCCVVAMVLCFFLLRGRTKAGKVYRRLPITSNTPGQGPGLVENLLRIDWVGAALFIGGGVLVLLALNWGSTEGWDTARVIVGLVVGALLFAMCIGWQYILGRQEYSTSPSSIRLLWAEPMIPLSVFRVYDIVAVMYASFISGMIMIVMFYFVAIFMTIVTGLSATRSGVQLIFFAPGMGLGALLGVRLIKTFRQPKYPIILGSIIMCIAIGFISMGMKQNRQAVVDGFMATAGVGTGMSIGPLAVQARFVLPAERVAVITALTLFFRSFGGTVGLAQCAAILNAKVKASLLALVDSGALAPADLASLAEASSHGGLNSLQSINALTPHLQSLVRDAFREGTRWCFLSMIPWCGVSVFLSLFLRLIEDTDKVQREETAPVEKAEAGKGEKEEKGSDSAA